MNWFKCRCNHTIMEFGRTILEEFQLEPTQYFQLKLPDKRSSKREKRTLSVVSFQNAENGSKIPIAEFDIEVHCFLVHWSHLLYFTTSNIPTQQFRWSEKNILRKAIKDIRLHMSSSIMYDVKYSLSKYHLIFSYHDIHWIQIGGNLAVNSH